MPPSSLVTDSLRKMFRPTPGRVGTGSIARKTALVFVLVGTGWVYLEEYIIGGHAFLKDLVFVLGTAFFLYALIKYATAAIRKSEAELREAEERLRGILECNPAGVLLIDREGRFSYGNSAAMRILGMDRSEILGRTWQDFSWKATTEGDPTSETEICFERPDGDRIILSVNAAPLQGLEGTSAGTVVSFTDITESKRAQESVLRESREKYREMAALEKEAQFREMFLQNEVPNILFRQGTAQVLDANPAAESLYGYTREDLLEKGLAPVADPPEYETLALRIGSIDGGEGLAIDEAHHVRKDGRKIIVSVRGKSIVTLSGDRFLSCSFHDITERIRMEEEVKLRQAELIHTSRMAFLGKIVAEIAHELNNPNNLIMFNTPMIQLAWEDAVRILERHRRETGDFPLGGLPFSEMRDSVPRLLQGISEASIRMGNYVESLNEFSRPKTWEQDRAVSVRRIISSAICILNHEIMKRCNDFLVDYPPDSLVVAGSRVELEQVLINLIHNSLHALPDRDRPVRVSASGNESSDSVEIVVRDEGEGMSPDVMKNILKPFFTTKQDSGGLGLGLSISRSIIERHKGTLVFDSEVGKGTTARIILPGLGLREGQGTMTPSVDYPR